MQMAPPQTTSPCDWHEIRLGCRGWRHPALSGALYPEDLPEEWQLGYYANHFSTVLLPQAELLAATPAEVAQWREEVSERFCFLLEWQGGALEPFMERARALAPQLGALLVGPEAAADVAGLQRLGELAVPLLGYTNVERLPPVWRGEGDPPWGATGCAFTLLTGEGARDLRSLRRIAEHALATLRADRPTALLMVAEPPDLRMLEQLSQLIELL